MGPSGCGKSTLLNILGLIDSPTAGSYWFMGEDIAKATEEELTLHRRAGVGFVFQNFNLIDDLTVAENVEVALIYRRVSGSERRKRVAAALERVDLAHRAKHMPKQLSGGQQQRVAVARAVMEMLTSVAKAGTTIIMVTHSEEHAARADRVVHMLDGRFVDDDEE
jgi:putative ABC transport system ATP-binding protein